MIVTAINSLALLVVNLWPSPCSTIFIRDDRDDAVVASAHRIRAHYADQSETETQDKKEPTREKTKEQKRPAAADQ